MSTPSVRTAPVPAATRPDAPALSESALQALCFRHHWNTYPDERRRLFMVYNTPKNAAHGAVLKGMGMVAGVSDLQYLAPTGKVWFLECKLPGQNPAPAQLEFADTVRPLGHEYRVFRTLEEFCAILDEARLPCTEDARRSGLDANAFSVSK